MSVSNLITELSGKGLLMTYDNVGRIRYWPSNIVSEPQKQILKDHKPSVIAFLQGSIFYLKGDRITCPLGNGLIYEVDNTNRKIAVSGIEEFPLVFASDECATMTRYLFLRDRITTIESYIYQHPQWQWKALFNAFEHEWRWLFKELNRQQFLIEAWSGPMISPAPYRTHGVQNELSM